MKHRNSTEIWARLCCNHKKTGRYRFQSLLGCSRKIAATLESFSRNPEYPWSTLQLEQLAEVLDTTARHLRLGESFASALQSAVSSQHFAIQILQNYSRACALGEAASEISKRLLKTAKTKDEQFVLKTLELSATGGVGGVMALERAAIVIRERATHIDDRFAQAAQALLSTRILSWTPLIVAGWLIVSSAPVRHYLILSPSGWVCLLLGIGLNLAGRKWMDAIITPSVVA